MDKKDDFRETVLMLEQQRLEIKRAKIELVREKFIFEQQCRSLDNNN